MRLAHFGIGLLATGLVFPIVGGIARAFVGLEAAVPVALVAWPAAALWFATAMKRRD